MYQYKTIKGKKRKRNLCEIHPKAGVNRGARDTKMVGRESGLII